MAFLSTFFDCLLACHFLFRGLPIHPSSFPPSASREAGFRLSAFARRCICRAPPSPRASRRWRSNRTLGRSVARSLGWRGGHCLQASFWGAFGPMPMGLGKEFFFFCSGGEGNGILLFAPMPNGFGQGVFLVPIRGFCWNGHLVCCLATFFFVLFRGVWLDIALSCLAFWWTLPPKQSLALARSFGLGPEPCSGHGGWPLE